MKAHIIEGANTNVLYFPNSYKFFKIDDLTKNIICDIHEEMNKSEIIEKYNIGEEDYYDLHQIVNDTTSSLTELQAGPKGLYKLVLNITNECNLNCVYCYANGGTYQSDKGVMQREVLEQALSIFFNRYNNIGVIQLFGGEPTLNLNAIAYVGAYIEQKLQNKEIDYKPVLCLTTNGMCSSEKFIDLVNRYDIKLTVSIDGPRSVTNQTRLANTGAGVADILEDNIQKLRARTGQPQSAEVTFTQLHVEQDIEVREVVNYLGTRFGITDVHVSPVSAEEGAAYKLKNRDSFLKAIPEVIRNKEDGYMLVNRIIDNLRTKRMDRHICNAGTSIYSVSSSGDIYPCFMLTDVWEHRLGNVNSVDEEFWSELESPANPFRRFDKLKNEQCKDCFNNTMCNGCMGINHFGTGDIFKSPEEECSFLKGLTEQVLLALCEEDK
ncbi:radical SAM/SPASM domain-containing protein [Paenibacillus phytohabitans]|nr:radical SAM protein [Paenibacillus phytohabitans]